MNPKVAIIILTYNGNDDTIECLNSVKKINYDNYKIVVVDNASTDGTVEALKKEFPKLKVIETGANLGYTGGNNAGVDYAMKKEFDYALILNNDTTVDKNLVQEMVKTYENNENVGMVGVMELDYFKPKKILNFSGKIDWHSVGRHTTGEGSIDEGQYTKELEGDFISGVCFLIPIKVIKKIGGLFDPLFHTYFEDFDLCARVAHKGYRLIANPKAKIWHRGSNTTKKISGYILYYITRNKFLFMKRNATKKDFWKYIRFFFFRAFPIDIKRMFLKKEFKDMGTYIKAVLNGTLLIVSKVKRLF